MGVTNHGDIVSETSNGTRSPDGSGMLKECLIGN